MSVDASRHIQELYAIPLKEFTSARNAKAAALKTAGQDAEAQAVKRLGRPTIPLWAANQLSRLVPKQMSDFIDLVQRARRTQLTDSRSAAEAVRAQRTALAALTNRAAEAMTKAGYRASAEALERISNTVLGAALNRHLSEDLRHGRLTAERPAPGFEALAGVGADLRVLRGGRAPGLKSEQAAAERARERVERVREERAAPEHEEAEAARRDAAQRAEIAERASQEVRDLERQLAEARRRCLAAQQQAAAAARRVPRPTDR